MQTTKCIVIGDYYVGKTSLFTSYTQNMYPQKYQETLIYDKYSGTVSFDNKDINLLLYDIAGNEIYEIIRPQLYEDAKICLMCFSVVNPESFENIKYCWYPEIKECIPDISIILVGTKMDLRFDERVVKKLQDDNLSPITHSQGLELSRQLKCAKYIECSAVTQDGVDELFNDAVRLSMVPRRPKKKPLN
uniref:CSON002872 protein n=1 Tax=Culicoides sonorensis TaxID=179676 RepID=A0A336L1H2_CULSO